MAANTSPTVFNVDVSPPATATEFNVLETPRAFDVTGDMNGKENVKVGVTQDRILTIVGQQSKSVQKAEDNGDVKTVTEKVLYQRAVCLPVSVDESAISAKMTNEGHLYLCMPKKGLDISAAPAVGAC